MKTTLPEIHISDVRTFRQCRRKWEWSSPLRRNLEPYIVYPPFFTGRAIHSALEMHYRDGVDLVKAFEDFVTREEQVMKEQGELWPQEANTFEEQTVLAYNMLQHYSMWQQSDTKKYSDKNLKFIHLEYPFEVPLTLPSGRPSRRMRIGGRFDGLVYNTLTDEYWIWETKTTRSITELTGSLGNDEQSALYLYAAQKVFRKPIAGVLYNIIRKKEPTQPRVLQNGLLSKMAIDTTTFHYLNCIKEHHPDWSMETIQEFYGDMLLSLEPNEYKYFLRWPVYKSAVEIQNVMEGVLQTGLEMINPKTPLYPAPSWLACNFCHFKGPCLAKNMGGDYEVLLKEEYRERVVEEDLDDLPTNNGN